MEQMVKKISFVSMSALAKGLETVSGVVLLCVVALTIVDIVGRFFGKPVVGTYELVSAAGGLVVSFAMPISIMGKKHVVIDLIVERLSIQSKIVLHIATRLMAAALFLIVAWSFMRQAHDLRSAKEVSSILQFPLHPLVYAMGGAFLGVCLALIDDLWSLKRFREAEHG
jgi:TRAP-type C4-dicarboxylate transport system permease small subunit